MKRALFILPLIIALFISCELIYPEGTEPRLRAILIGLDYHQSAFPLLNPPLDAQGLDQTLMNLAKRFKKHYSSILMIQRDGAPSEELLTYPSKENVLNKIEEEISKLRSNDLLLIYYSGHGNEEFNLILDIEQSKSISKDELYQLFEARRRGRILLIVDACYSGGFLPDTFNSYVTVLSASKSDEKALGGSYPGDYSFFTRYLLEVLGGLNHQDKIPALLGGVISAASIYSAIQSRIGEHNQTPLSLEGLSDLALFW